ncbi:hypothetical protein WMF45_47415 [Sorangium sp. So ce448]|uniref:hypothetical protein n=1 Tax=Sorangium sp. So ce448 TaxID=3133314 RepID=UPI003F63680F
MTSDVLRVLAAALLSSACLMGCKNSVHDGVGVSFGNGGSGGSSSGEVGTGGSGGHNGGSGGDDSGGHNGSSSSSSGGGGIDDSGEDGSGGCSDGCSDLSYEPSCEVRDVEGTIPGVKISIASSRCAYHRGEPAEFVYTITTDSSVPPIDLAASTGCGRCVEPTSDPLSLVSYKISGLSWGADPQPQLYCLCDVGCCAPDEAVTVQVDATTVTQTIRWSGRQWTGPSDTSTPEGDPFAPGSYEVEVTFDGQGQGSVTAKLPIEIYP